MNNLEQIINEARRREMRDDHLSNEERSSIVEMYINENPSFQSEGNVNDDFVNIVID